MYLPRTRPTISPANLSPTCSEDDISLMRDIGRLSTIYVSSKNPDDSVPTAHVRIRDYVPASV